MSERYGSGHPYPVQSLSRARELSECGWKPADVHRLMREEGLPTPDVRTVQRWVDDGHNQKQLAASRRGAQVKGASRATFRLSGAQRPGGPSEAYRAAFVSTLLKAGVVCDSVEKVCAVVMGECGPSTPRRGRPTARRNWNADKTARLLALGLEMRRRKVPYTAISAAFELWEGEHMEPAALRRWLTLHGAERDASKSRTTTMTNLKRNAKP